MDHSLTFPFGVAGTLPADICVKDVPSSLSDLFLGQNQLMGTVDITHCLNMVVLDASYNKFSGTLLSPSGYNHLHAVHLANNSINSVETLNNLIVSRHLTDISLANN